MTYLELVVRVVPGRTLAPVNVAFDGHTQELFVHRRNGSKQGEVPCP